MSKRLDGRNGDVYTAYIMGYTQEAIADRFGIGQQRVSSIIKAVQASIPVVDLAEQRARHTDAMGRLSTMMAEIADMPPVPLYSNGRPVLDANGNQVMDYSQRMAAADRHLKIQERVSKLLGLDAPLKQDVTVNDAASRAAEAAAAEALSRLHGDVSDVDEG